jgi:hypothetical protein
MAITRETIEQLYRHYDELDVLEQQASAAIKVAQEHKNEEITIAQEGKSVTVREKDLWDETWTLGPACEAGALLREKYPDAFEISDRHAAKAQELREFTVAKLGIDYRAMKLSDILRLVEGVIELKLQQHADGTTN